MKLHFNYPAQKYTTQQIVERDTAGEAMDFIFFLKTSKADPLDVGCFCQWQKCFISDEVRNYTHAEQYMMAQKALLFDDEEILEKIMAAKKPKDMLELGRQIKNFDQAVWDKEKYHIVLNGNFLKFSQNTLMGEILLSTEDKIICEANPSENIWSIGYAADDVKARQPKEWGQNLLGFALMHVRDELRDPNLVF
jgi:ribA/ribD-fused uncharacterized protein